MDALAKIAETLAWPVTAIIIVMLLRAPLQQLIPTLKKLKYKDIELEFEREASKILSEAERDLPTLPKGEQEPRDSDIKFNIARLKPVTEILESWRNLELHLRDTAKSNSIDGGRTIRSLINELHNNEFISDEAAKITLELAALRNKVTHTDDTNITYVVSSAFSASVERIINAMK